jgi:putative membrane protein
MTTREIKIVKKASFNPDVRKYWLLNGIVICTVTLVGIPFIPIWYVIGLWITGRYLARLECILTEKTLIVRKGIWVRTEKTVPLDKITDLGMIQGPIMRVWNIQAVSVETAGQSGQGALIRLYGIENAEDFRDTVLAQRDVMMEKKAPLEAVETDAPSSDKAVELLTEIRDLLKSNRS